MNKQHWKYKKLGEITTLKSGYTPSSSDLLESGAIPYFKVGDMNKEGNEKYLIYTSSFVDSSFKSYPKGSIVFPKNGAAIATNKKRILSRSSVVDLNTAALIPSNTVKIDFLYYWISKVDFRIITRRGAVPTLDTKVLMQLEIPVPPVAEQERIVAELDLLSGIIEKKKEQLKAYDQLAQSIFYTMFGDPIDNPKGWEVKNMEDVGELQRGSGLSKKDLTEDGFPCILYGQVHTRFGAYTNKHIACIPQELVSTAKIAHFGDIVMAITSEDVEGSCKSVAWMGNYDIAVGSDAAIYRHTLNPIYVSYYTQTKAFYFEKAKYAKGFKVTHISTKEIAKIPIPVPPLSLQQEFAEKVEAIERQKALVQQSIEETQTMFDYTMDKYFG